jgi:hypothetical protein
VGLGIGAPYGLIRPSLGDVSKLRAGAVLCFAVLRGAIEDFAGMIASRFLGLASASTDEVLAAYARDHLTHLPHIAPAAAPAEHRWPT